jgi:hypothetical protein
LYCLGTDTEGIVNSEQKQRAGRQPERALSGQENLAGWHASRWVVRKAEAFSQAGKQAGRGQGGRHTGRQNQKQISLMMAVYEAKHIGDNVI